MKPRKQKEYIMVFCCEKCPGSDMDNGYCNIANYKKENPEYGRVIVSHNDIPPNCPLRRTRIVLMLGDYLEG